MFLMCSSGIWCTDASFADLAANVTIRAKFGAVFMPTFYTTLGPLTLQTFTFFMMLSVLVSAGISLSRAGENRGKWADLSLAALVVGAVGARAGHVILNWSYF